MPEGVALLPDHEPLAVHEVMFAPLQKSAAVEPFETLHGPFVPLHWRSMVGAGGALTFTVTESETLPPGPEHVMLKVTGPEASVGPDSLLAVLRGPGDIQGPEPVEHVVASVEVQESVGAVFQLTLQRTAPLQRKSKVGAGGAPTFTVTESFALPPGPVQVST